MGVRTNMLVWRVRKKKKRQRYLKSPFFRIGTRKPLASGMKLKGVPKHHAVKTSNVLMQFKK